MDMNFDDLKPQEHSFNYLGKNYILREPTEGAAAEWENLNAKAARMIDGKVIGVDGIADSAATLVARCVFELVKGKGESYYEREVSVAVIRGWPRRMTRVLYEKTKEMAGLNEISDPSILKKRIDADTKRLKELTAHTSNGDIDKSSDHPAPPAHLAEEPISPFDREQGRQPTATSPTSV